MAKSKATQRSSKTLPRREPATKKKAATKKAAAPRKQVQQQGTDADPSPEIMKLQEKVDQLTRRVCDLEEGAVGRVAIQRESVGRGQQAAVGGTMDRSIGASDEVAES